MIEKYFNATNFSNTEEFAKGFHIHVPDNFNFAYDIVDEWATQAPNKRALCWVNEHGRHHDFTFGEMKQLSDAAASFFQSIGIGAGQMSRVYSAKIAGIKAQDEGLTVAGCVMASDAFFPFRDGIDAAAKVGIQCVIHPGGSMRDQEVIDAADEHNMVMVLTGMRHFRH